jgi:hypothetical protein
MPADTTVPANGSNVVASAQLLQRFNLVVFNDVFAHPGTGFEPPAGNLTKIYIGSLPKVFISLLLFPQYDRGDFVFEARNYLSWRVVAVNPGTAQPGFPDVTTNTYVPISTPQLLPVGQPIHFVLPNGGGVENIALEFDTTSEEPEINQGQDRVIVTMSASQ